MDSSGPFVRSYMLANGRNDAPRGNRGNYPARTFTSGIYTAGYSDHLPVYIVLEAF